MKHDFHSLPLPSFDFTTRTDDGRPILDINKRATPLNAGRTRFRRSLLTLIRPGVR